jgi:hypothetical protein
MLFRSPMRRSLPYQPCLERLEDRSVPSAFWGSFAGTGQHTGQAPVTSAPLNRNLWQTPVDLYAQYSGGAIHYGSPVLTDANTVIVPVKTGISDGFRVEGHDGTTGDTSWTETTDYTLPPHGWTPSYSPVLTANGRLYYPGAGGTVYYIDDVDGTPTDPVRLAYYGIDAYNANPSAYKSTVFIDTPLTADSSGDIFFGVRVTGSNPSNLVSGIVRIGADGTGSWVSAASATGDNVGEVPLNCAPALSNDASTLYIGVRGASGHAYLVGLDTTTLLTQDKVLLKDPRNNFINNAVLLDDSTSSPMVGPDGDVYYGIFGNPSNGSRGFLAHFSADLSQTKTFGGFGWDSTPVVVPASMVPMYTGSSSYLLFEKYNNYVSQEVSDGGDGVNQIALLDPNDTMVDPHSSSNGLLVMNAVMSIPGPTRDLEFTGGQANAVREWCINTALVDPATYSIVAPSEDGKLYRWDLSTCSFTQAVTINPTGASEAYVPTLEGPDGTVYTIESGTLFAVGGLANGLTVSASSSVPDGLVYGQEVTFTASVTSIGAPAPTGSVTFKDGSTVLGTLDLDSNGTASFTTSSLSAGRHFITAAYSGDGTYGPGSVVLVQPVLQTPIVTLTAKPNPSVYGQAVTFTATVAAGGPTVNVPEGTVTFLDGTTVLKTVTLNSLGLTSSNGKVSFTTSALTAGSHTITAIYSGDTNFTGATSDPFNQIVNNADTTTTVSSSANPAVSGQAVTFTAVVQANAPGAGIPTGSVTFMDGDTILGTGAVDATGTATFTTTDLDVGDHSITAVYGGDGNLNGSVSAVLTQTVNPAGPAPRVSTRRHPSPGGPTGRTVAERQVVSAPQNWLPALVTDFVGQVKRKGTGAAAPDRLFASAWE